MKAGWMRHHCDFQKNTITADAHGAGGTSSWADVDGLTSVPCSIRPYKAEEIMESKQLQMEVTHEVTTRYNSAILEEYRMVFNSRNFDIISILNTDERNIVMKLSCKEIK